MTNFPDNPTLNQEFTAMGRTWKWNGTAWQAVTSSHTHPLSDLTQSGATTGQVPSWNGTAWVPQTPSGGGGGTPPAHASTHATGGSDPITPAAIGAATAAQGAKADTALQPGTAIANISGLQTALDGKQASGSYAPATGISPTAITGTAVVTSDSRLSDARTPLSHSHSVSDVTGLQTALDGKAATSHSHGNITSAGAIGTTAALPVITGNAGVLQAGSFGATAGTFCQGNDSRLSDSRPATPHKASHATGGADALTPADIGAATDAHTHAVATTSAAGFMPALSFDTLTYAATTNLDLAALDGQYRTINLTGNLTLTTSNRAAGRGVVLRLVADATNRTLYFPAWTPLSAVPSTIFAGKTIVLSLTAFGAAESDCAAVWALQP